jgi:hypothetical protein
MSTSSSSPLSTRRLTEGDGLTTLVGGGAQLLVVHSRTLIVAHAPSTAPPPSVSHVPAVSITMANLRTELECHRLGEDGRVTI